MSLLRAAAVLLEQCRDQLFRHVIGHERRVLEPLVRRGRGPSARREPLFDRYTLIGMAVADAQDRVFHYFTRDAAAEVFRQLPYTQPSYLRAMLAHRVRSNALSMDEALPRSSWQRDAPSFRISTTQNSRKKSLEKPVFKRIFLEVPV